MASPFTLNIRKNALIGGWYLVWRYIAVSLVSVGGNVLLARWLGPQLVGVFAIAQFIFSIAPELLGRGLAIYLVKVTEQPSDEEIGTALIMQRTLGAILGLTTIAAAYPLSVWYQSSELKWLLLGTGIGVTFYAWRAVPVALLERTFDYRRVMIIEISEVIVFYGIALIGTGLGYGILSLSIAMGLRGVVSMLTSAVISQKKYTLFWDIRSAKRIWNFGGAFIGTVLISLLMAAVPTILVGKYVDLEALGFVNTGFLILNYLTFIITPLSRVMFNAYSRLNNDVNSLVSTTNEMLHYIAAYATPLLTIATGLSPLWIKFVFGEDWEPMSWVLILGSPSYFFWILSSQMNSVFFAIGESKRVLIYMFILNAVYWILSIALLDSFRGLAVPIALSISHAVVYFPLIMFDAHRRWKRINILRISASLLIGITGLFVLGYSADNQLWLLMCISIIGLGVIWFMTFKGEWQKLYKIFNTALFSRANI